MAVGYENGRIAIVSENPTRPNSTFQVFFFPRRMRCSVRFKPHSTVDGPRHRRHALISNGQLGSIVEKTLDDRKNSGTDQIIRFYSIETQLNLLDKWIVQSTQTDGGKKDVTLVLFVVSNRIGFCFVFGSQGKDGKTVFFSISFSTWP